MEQFTGKEKRKEKRPASGESPFFPGEVFYSRTDRRGVIASGNYVFHRVAGYGMNELLGEPHKVIRHPDMPRGVFQLLWQRILDGKMTGAYVKNRAKDGLYYWVYAVVAPWQDGFLSARMKPTSPLLDKIEELYGELRARETDDGVDPEASAAILLDRLKALGFDDYDDFMAHALGEELLAESRALEVAPDRNIEMAREMLEIAQSLYGDTRALVAEFKGLNVVPHNMRVAATRLEPTGGPISALSLYYGSMSQKLSVWFDEYVLGPDSNFARITDSVKDTLILNCAAGILYRCEKQLQAERRHLSGVDLAGEREMLQALNKSYIARAQTAAAIVRTEAERVRKACDDMRRQLLGLSTVHIACKIENARLAQMSRELSGIIDRLDSSQGSIGELLNTIRQSSFEIAEGASDILNWDRDQLSEDLLYGKAMAAALRAGDEEGAAPPT